MVKPSHDYFEALLGVTAPWFIQELAIDTKNKIIQMELGYATEKARFAFLNKGSETDAPREQQNLQRWAHTNLGQYSCYIATRFMEPGARGQGISRDALTKPAFLGEQQRHYTHQLRQQVALAQVRGLGNDAIAQLYKVEPGVVEEILGDINATPEAYRLACCLPTEADAIWEKIITDKIHLKTQLFSLKLLLSKLKLASLDATHSQKLAEAVQELRKFFIAHMQALDTEYLQICAVSTKKQAQEERRSAVTKLVLPALKNSIWLKLITGKIDLKSTNVSLNLFLVRLRHAFQQSSDNQARITTLNSLREFFKKNARSLKPELVLINKLMNAPEETQFTLPSEQHEIWKRILKDDAFIPSTYMAYKLLLANLRSQMLMNPDPVVELNAARKVREFINHNQRFMQDELRMVMRSAYSA